jgi:hypothetical protein
MNFEDYRSCRLVEMTEQNRKYITKEIGKLLSDIWRIKGLAEQEYGSQHPIIKKLSGMYADAQELLQEKSGARNQ